jgi:hypothetical protein
VLGLYGEADVFFAEAAALNTRGGVRFAEAHAYLHWGRMLLRRAEPGDAERASQLLHEAEAIAAANGYALIERWAQIEPSDFACRLTTELRAGSSA